MSSFAEKQIRDWNNTSLAVRYEQGQFAIWANPHLSSSEAMILWIIAADAAFIFADDNCWYQMPKAGLMEASKLGAKTVDVTLKKLINRGYVEAKVVHAKLGKHVIRRNYRVTYLPLIDYFENFPKRANLRLLVNR